MLFSRAGLFLCVCACKVKSVVVYLHSLLLCTMFSYHQDDVERYTCVSLSVYCFGFDCTLNLHLQDRSQLCVLAQMLANHGSSFKNNMLTKTCLQ